MKNKILKFIVFLVAWAFIYWISNNNFGVVSFLFACLFVYAVDKGALVFLANEFDRNHNALADNVRYFQERLTVLEDENSNLRQRIDDLEQTK